MFGRYSLYKEGIAYAGGEFSGQWVVVSGQFYLRKVVEKLVIDELKCVKPFFFDEPTSFATCIQRIFLFGYKVGNLTEYGFDFCKRKIFVRL